MLKRFFRRGNGKAAASGPPGSRAYAIGDIHGRLDLLKALLRRIEEDNRTRGPARKTYIVTLGDLVDRGPDSSGVIEHLIGEHPRWATMIHLKGNHEEVFTRILSGEADVASSWLIYGGYECAQSYGVTKGHMLNAAPHEITDRVIAAVPPAHRQFLEELGDSFRFGDYLFVHAGIRPGVAIEEQSARDLRWIRNGFLDDSTDHGMMVVHGHTIVEQAEEHPNRIAIDTGAYRSGVLTALGIEGAERWFVTATVDHLTGD